MTVAITIIGIETDAFEEFSDAIVSLSLRANLVNHERLAHDVANFHARIH